MGENAAGRSGRKKREEETLGSGCFARKWHESDIFPYIFHERMLLLSENVRIVKRSWSYLLEVGGVGVKSVGKQWLLPMMSRDSIEAKVGRVI